MCALIPAGATVPRSFSPEGITRCPYGLVPHEKRRGRGCVQRAEALDAVDLGLEKTVCERFPPLHAVLHRRRWPLPQWGRPKGIQEMAEEMLRGGAPLTGVGELVLDHSCVRLQPPRGRSMQYCLSGQDRQPARGRVRRQLWKVLVLVFGFAACASLFFLLRKQYLRRPQRRRPEEEFRGAHLSEEDRPEEDRRRPKGACVVCLSNFSRASSWSAARVRLH